jgi:hypothetical protein
MSYYDGLIKCWLFWMTSPFPSPIIRLNGTCVWSRVQQKIAGTFRSEDGATAFCRIRSYLSTMRKQGHAMLTALAAVFAAQPLPIAWDI